VNPRAEPNRDPLNRSFYLPRLPRPYYQGDAVIHWTLTIEHRKQGWLSAALESRFRELMLHTAAREGLICPIYCLMPDHLHLVWMGLRLDTDQMNGMAFLRTYLEPALRNAKFQGQAQDRVLREQQRKRGAFAKVCFYDAANPVREQLVERAEDWPHTNSVIPGYPKLHPLEGGFWQKFWQLYFQMRQTDAGNVLRPRL
jgi:REP element-mobilizing transposase RayT